MKQSVIIFLILFSASIAFGADYTVKTDGQGEQSLEAAIAEWIEANTVTTNVVTKGPKGEEIFTPTKTVPTMTKDQFLQKLVDDKLSETFTKMKGKEKGDLIEKWDSISAAKREQIKVILEAK